MSTSASDGWLLRVYMALANYTTPFFNAALKRRLKQGKEHPSRYQEKLGLTTQPRPPGTLVWMHGVGLGEVLALRGLIDALQLKRDELSFLVTSSTSTSAEVFLVNCPDDTLHQFLPVDSTPAAVRFLNHWQPDISIWAEQDLWPALVCHTYDNSIPLVLLNARMNKNSFHKRQKVASLYRNLYRRFAWISTQDAITAKHMNLLGADATVGGSLKTAAVPLQDNPDLRAEFEHSTQGRVCWLLATSHKEDELLAVAAHRELLKQHPTALLIIAPREISRQAEIKTLCANNVLKAAVRSKQQTPDHQVYIADTFGEMGIWYRSCSSAFIGGSMNAVQGHNPWEAAALGCAIIHGPNTDNFHNDYESLQQHHAAHKINTVTELLQLLTDQQSLARTAERALALAQNSQHAVDVLADRVIALLDSERS